MINSYVSWYWPTIHPWLLLAHIPPHRYQPSVIRVMLQTSWRQVLLREQLESKGQRESCWPMRPLSKRPKTHWLSSFPFVNSLCIGGLIQLNCYQIQESLPQYPWWSPRDMELRVSGVWNWLVPACGFQLCVSLPKSMCIGVKLVASIAMETVFTL